MRMTMVLLGVFAGLAVSATAEPVEFSTDILPVLASKCFPCHGPNADKREAEIRFDIEGGLFSLTRDGFPIVKRGDPDNSELWWRIGVADPDDRMPPADFRKSLTPGEIATLKRWSVAIKSRQSFWIKQAPSPKERLR